MVDRPLCAGTIHEPTLSGEWFGGGRGCTTVSALVCNGQGPVRRRSKGDGEMKVTGNTPRLLYVLGLALMGLSFYVVVLLLLVVGAMSFFSSHAHAQVAPTRAPAVQVLIAPLRFATTSRPGFPTPVDAAGICSASHSRKA
jgi:hypothetical protein